VKLEERSRDLAEENLKKEIANCLKLLEVRTLTFGNYRFVKFSKLHEFICITKTITRYQTLSDSNVN
jgi:hypothetical protein